jgi:uncharacterized protein YbjT (DUF2867 family)
MILLTGATGTAGSFIAKEFMEQREPVRILVRNRAKANWFEKYRLLKSSRAICLVGAAWHRL